MFLRCSADLWLQMAAIPAEQKVGRGGPSNTLRACKLPIRTWRDPNEPCEVDGEMTLAAKAGRERYLCHRERGLAQQLPGLRDPGLKHVLVWTHSSRLFEEAGEMVRAQTRQPGQCGEREILVEVGIHILYDSLKVRAGQSCGIRRTIGLDRPILPEQMHRQKLSSTLDEQQIQRIAGSTLEFVHEMQHHLLDERVAGRGDIDQCGDVPADPGGFFRYSLQVALLDMNVDGLGGMTWLSLPTHCVRVAPSRSERKGAREQPRGAPLSSRGLDVQGHIPCGNQDEVRVWDGRYEGLWLLV